MVACNKTRSLGSSICKAAVPIVIGDNLIGISTKSVPGNTLPSNSVSNPPAVDPMLMTGLTLIIGLNLLVFLFPAWVQEHGFDLHREHRLGLDNQTTRSFPWDNVVY